MNLKDLTLGVLGSQLRIVIDKIEVETEATKKLNAQKSEIIDVILEKMEAQGTNNYANDVISLTRKVSIHPKITNAEEFFKWVAENNAWEYLSKTCNAKAYRENFELGEKLPAGTDNFTKPTISYRRKE